MKSDMYKSMFETESFHWYFKSKHEIVLSIIDNYHVHDAQIVDFGCGCELMLKLLSKYGNVAGDEITAIRPEFYTNTAALLNPALFGCDSVPDIGNGGVLNYDFADIPKLDCTDHSLSQNAVEKYKAYVNISFFQADIMNLENICEQTYDAVIQN